jgi:hypothetical protein
MFGRDVFLPYTLKMEAARSIRTSVNVYHTTWRHGLEDGNLHSHCHENFSLTNRCSGSAYLDTVRWRCVLAVVLCNPGRRKDLAGSGALLLSSVLKWNHNRIDRSHTFCLPLPLLLTSLLLLASFLIYTGWWTISLQSLPSAHNF